MQKETRRNSAAGSTKPNPPRKLTRAEKKQIAEIIRQAKGDGKAHTAQQTIPYIWLTLTPIFCISAVIAFISAWSI